MMDKGTPEKTKEGVHIGVCPQCLAQQTPAIFVRLAVLRLKRRYLGQKVAVSTGWTRDLFSVGDH